MSKLDEANMTLSRRKIERKREINLPRNSIGEVGLNKIIREGS